MLAVELHAATAVTVAATLYNGAGVKQGLIVSMPSSGAAITGQVFNGTANFNGDNTLTDGVESTFNASTGGFSITTRLIGPMSYIAEPSEQATRVTDTSPAYDAGEADVYLIFM